MTVPQTPSEGQRFVLESICALADRVVVMTEAAYAFVSGPTMVAEFTGVVIDNDELGGAVSHSRYSGSASLVTTGIAEAIEIAELLLAYFPQHNDEEPPRWPTDDDVERLTPEAGELIPASSNGSYDVRSVIRALADGYETIIGERGISLSGGQRQRIAIARAFLMDPRIIILDDATASVDSKTEHQIQDAMRRLCAGRTTFVIAQRLSTVQQADHILVLEEGRLVAEGRHDALIGRAGVYREIFGQQMHTV